MAMCQHASKQSVKTLMPTGRNADDRKWQNVAAVMHGRHTANHQLAVWYGCQSKPIPTSAETTVNVKVVRFIARCAV